MSQSDSDAKPGCSSSKALKSLPEASTPTTEPVTDYNQVVDSILSPAIAAAAAVTASAAAAAAAAKLTTSPLGEKRAGSAIAPTKNIFDGPQASFTASGTSSSKPAPTAPHPSSSTDHLKLDLTVEATASFFKKHRLIPFNVKRIPQPWAIGQHWKQGESSNNYFFLGDEDGKRLEDQSEFDTTVCTIGSAERSGGEENHRMIEQRPGVVPLHCQIYPGVGRYYTTEIIVQFTPSKHASHSVKVLNRDTVYTKLNLNTFAFEGAAILEIGDQDVKHIIRLFPAGTEKTIEGYFLSKSIHVRYPGPTFVGLRVSKVQATDTGKAIRSLHRIVIKITGVNNFREATFLRALQEAVPRRGKLSIIKLLGNNSADAKRERSISLLEYHSGSVSYRHQDPSWKNGRVLTMAMAQVFSAVEFIHANTILHSHITLQNLLIDLNVELGTLEFRIYLAYFEGATKFPRNSDKNLFSPDIEATGRCFVELLSGFCTEQLESLGLKHAAPIKGSPVIDIENKKLCEIVSKVVKTRKSDQATLCQLLEIMTTPDASRRITMGEAVAYGWSAFDEDTGADEKQDSDLGSTTPISEGCGGSAHSVEVNQNAETDLRDVQSIQTGRSSKPVTPVSSLPATSSASPTKRSISPPKRKGMQDEEEY